MKAATRILRAFLAGLLGLACVIGVLALYNNFATAKERGSLPPPGKMVDIGYGRMHVYTEGRGSKNVVLLPGYGNPCPLVDFRPLIDALKDRYRVTVVDYFGYGWSDGTSRARTSSNIVDETRKALRGAGIEPPYVLMPHSLSGIYALYYAREFPDEVEAVIGLDTSVPETNAYVKKEKAVRFSARTLLREAGILRVAESFHKNVAGYPREYYGVADIAMMDRMACWNVDNSTIINESNAIYDNRQELVGAEYPRGMAVAMILADSSVGNSRRYLNGMDWLQAHKDEISGCKGASIHVLHGSHNIYWNNAAAIAGIVDGALGSR